MVPAKPKLGKIKATPLNIITGIILIMGIILTIARFTGGLGAVTNLDNNNPWGIWIGFDLLCGVALAAGGYVTSAACYIFGLKRFHSAVRPAILTAFLGYALVVFALNYDVGRPWRLPYPLFFSQGTSSLLFEVGLCVFLYLNVLFIEFIPAVLEWLGFKLGFAKAASFIMMGYLGIKIIGISVDNNWHNLASSWGAWFIFELAGFVALPSFLYAIAVREKNLKLVRIASVLALLGVVLNRLNISIIAFNWHLPTSERYFPSWMEIGTSIFIVTLGITVYRFITNHMPVLYEHPDYK